MTNTNDRTARTPLIVLGDYETADCLGELADTARDHGATIAEIHAYPPGTAHDAEDLADVDGAVGALASAITNRANVWVPYPLQDMPREAHWRRLSLALQRHGLNLVVGPHLVPSPTTGGINEADFALRAEVRAVDRLDQAALSAAGAESLAAEIEQTLRGAAPDPTVTTVRRARTTDDGVANSLLERVRDLEDQHGPAPLLPAQAAPWPDRRRSLQRYARWLVGTCGLPRAVAADLLNALGQRTATGRDWQRATVSALVNGRYERKEAA